MMPTHVVVDTTNGYTFKNGSDGVLFDQRHATAFAAQRNADLKPAYRGAYQVFRLVDPVDPEQDNQLCAVCGAQTSAGPDGNDLCNDCIDGQHEPARAPAANPFDLFGN